MWHRQDLQAYFLGHVGQELGGLKQGAVLSAGAVDGQDVVSSMQGPTPVQSKVARWVGWLDQTEPWAPTPVLVPHPLCASPIHHAGRLDAINRDDWLVPVGACGE